MLRLKNPLAYPGGNSGFNSAHPAAYRCRVAAIASSSGFMSSLFGATPTYIGTISETINSFGPATNLITGARITYPIVSESVATSGVTFSAILTPITVSTAATIICCGNDGTSNQSVQFNMNSGLLRIYDGNATIASTITLVAGNTYFVAASYNGVAANFIALNLATGQLYTSVVSTAGTLGSTTGDPFAIGNRNTVLTSPINSWLSAVSYTARALPLRQLLQWAQAPWDFWYPRTFDGIFLSGLKSAAVAAPTHFSRGFPDGGVQVT